MRTEGRVGLGYGVSVAKIERFEGLIAWQKARIFTREIHEARRQGAFARDYGMGGQIQI
jgi:hypothetical protein